MKLLLVEDSRVLRERLRAMIEGIGGLSVVAETDNEVDAVADLEKYRPDVVVIDIRLRVGSGLSVLEHVRAVYPQMLTIILTNYGQPEYRRKCEELGVHHFFDKSRDLAAFTQVLVDAVRSGATDATAAAG